ncbi:hypothetical protein GCM10007320_63590 [Pseudorhodoferax aquiterrae]|uniref:DUF3606 domain-containing protein n=2 Tax=Pseudorhodoferax aquiterrae TaxID=747304 RepID=A0ABQ3GEW4_9BURK|nr:hypothetical protein GCM10007320_63590 [Pseudorhodoferax aquiterrae]
MWATGMLFLTCPFKLENTMADDKTKSGGSDRTRINVNEDYELRDWASKLSVTPERLKEAVQAVGSSADKVEQYLRDAKR